MACSCTAHNNINYSLYDEWSEFTGYILYINNNYSRYDSDQNLLGTYYTLNEAQPQLQLSWGFWEILATISMLCQYFQKTLATIKP